MSILDGTDSSPPKPKPKTGGRRAAPSPEAAELERRVHAARRYMQLKQAREQLIPYTRLSMPDPEDPENPERSRYSAHVHHDFIAAKLEQVESGESTRVIINIGPRHGKSELVSKRFPTWFVGRDPYRQVIVASYGDALATDFGRAAREIMRTPFYQQVFPGTALKKGSQAMDRLETTQGGVLVYRGIGSALTGYGADLAIIDDPLKDRETANSRAMREKHWDWFTQVLMTRLMGSMGRVVIVMTRWHEDDLVGRLTNPKNPSYDPELARQWEVINIPAIIETDQDKADDPFGREFGEVLWPERIPKKFLMGQRRLDPAGFNALYQGRPAPPEGNFFRRSHIQGYRPHELPRNLRYYAASDHAVSEAQHADPTCLGCVGVDENNNIYVMPDIDWRRMDSMVATESMLEQARRYKPVFWWAEKGHISKSIGPFLRKRMFEEQVYLNLVEKTPVADKMTRAQAIQARASMGKLYLPEFASWYQDAIDELLNFPYGTHDDFVDFLAWIGIGLAQQVRPDRPREQEKEVQVGSAAWIVADSEYRKRKARQTHRYLN